MQILFSKISFLRKLPDKYLYVSQYFLLFYNEITI
jgi:hypothetical protein